MKASPNELSRLAQVPLFSSLSDGERSDVAMGLQLRIFQAGEALIRQGTPSEGIYFILSGHVDITTKLPGGGETLIAQLGPRTVHGELGVIRSMVRTATVRANKQVEALYVDWRFLTAALSQLRPGAFKVFHQLTLVLADRTRALHNKIHEAVFRQNRPYEMSKLPAAPPVPAIGDPNKFDLDAFLPLLPCFRDFDANGIAAVRSRAATPTRNRGYHLSMRDDIVDRSYIVVRGAVASGFVEAERFHLIDVRGPGCFCAISPLIQDRLNSASYIVWENAILMEISRPDLLDLFLECNLTARAMLIAVTEHQAAMVSRATNHLKRLVGLTRLKQQLQGADASVVASIT